MKRLLSIALFAGLTFSLVGCGPPPENKNLKDLNEGQSKRLCEDLRTKLEDCDNFELEESNCEDYHDDYISELPDDCDATVGNVQKCIDSCGQNGDECEELSGCSAM